MLIQFNGLLWSIIILISVAYLTLLERKLLGFFQRRVGPNTVGQIGLLQPISDAIKLLTKQTSSTVNSSFNIFYFSPMWALIITFTGWGILIRLFNSDYYSLIPRIDNLLVNYSWLTLLALLGLTIYSVLLLGWAANSSYSLVGSLRSSSALISYELILATSGLLPMIVVGSYNLLDIIHYQTIIPLIIPLLPGFIIIFISILAETSRVPFDLVEAESELVSGYFTEHASVAFVLFFLNEYASILLFSTLITLLFLGPINYIILVLGIICNLTLIILARAVLPRIRYDQLILTCWLYLLPLIFSITVAVINFKLVI